MNKKMLLVLSFLLFSIGYIMAQSTKIVGTVVDSNNEPVISASVVIKGTTIGTITDLDGNFSINIPEGNNDPLVFYLVGMKSIEVKPTQGMKVVMESDEKLLE